MKKRKRVILPPPRNFYTNTLDWLLANRPRRLHQFFRPIYEGIPKPTLFEKNPADFYPDIQSAANVYVIPRGRVVGQNGTVISPDNKLLYDLSLDWVSSPIEHSIFHTKRLPPVRRTRQTIAVVAAKGGHNYYHWMYEILPRFELLQKSGLKIDKYVINAPYLPFHKESLALLGIPRRKLIISHNRLHLQARRLIVPSLPGFTVKWATDFLRNHFLPRISPISIYGLDRIYISRNDARYRRVANEEALMNLLSSYGFQCITLKDVPLLKKIELFTHAKWIIAPHGAALTNLAFCAPRTKVIEFFSPNYLNVCYWQVCNFYNLEYNYLICETKDPLDLKHLGDYWPGVEDITVNLEALQTLLMENNA